VPIFAVDGTNDPIQRYDGWLFRPAASSRCRNDGVLAGQHGCTGQQATSLPHRIAADPTRLLLVEWTGCKAEDAVRLYRVSGGGHHVPSFAPAPDDDWAAAAARTRTSKPSTSFGPSP
jgi:polyhydroxybutyrate depolymerase